jgi:hypothetical protein
MDELLQEVSVLRKSVNRVLLNSSHPAAASIFSKPSSTSASPHTGIDNDSAIGHHDDKHYWESAFGSHSHTPGHEYDT